MFKLAAKILTRKKNNPRKSSLIPKYLIFYFFLSSILVICIKFTYLPFLNTVPGEAGLGRRVSANDNNNKRIQP